MPMFEPGKYLDYLHRYEVTTMLGIPTMFIALLNHPDLSRHDLRRLRVCIAAGAPVPAEVQRQWKEKTGVELTQGWGMTECNAGAIVNIQNKKSDASIGVPTNGEVKVLNPETRAMVPIGETGEIMYRSPHLEGLLEQARGIQATFQPTAGSARRCRVLDKDGFIFFVDRIKDLIIASGHNISPFDVESTVMKHPAVLESPS